MDKVRQDEILAQTPEQTLADYARIDAIIAKGTYTNKWPKSQATRRQGAWLLGKCVIVLPYTKTK